MEIDTLVKHSDPLISSRIEFLDLSPPTKFTGDIPLSKMSLSSASPSGSLRTLKKCLRYIEKTLSFCLSFSFVHLSLSLLLPTD